jgi:hypothetical protein
MKLIQSKATIVLNAHELEMLANSINIWLVDQIRGHYNKMADKNPEEIKSMFNQQNKCRINMMTDFLRLAGEGHHVKNVKATLEMLLDDKIIQDVQPLGQSK